MDLMGSKVGESIERKRFNYAKAIHIICLYLKQLPVRTLINPIVIRRRMTIQIRYRGIPTRRTCLEKTMPMIGSPYERKPYFSP